MQKTILVANEHRIVREGLRKILEVRPDLRVVGEAETTEAALSTARRLQPSLAVVDIGPSGLEGITLIGHLRIECPDTRSLATSMPWHQEGAADALRAGAAGFLLTSGDADEVLVAIDEVLAGGSYVSPAIAHCLVDAVIHPGGPALKYGVTDRERDVLRLVAAGLSSREIAGELGISPRTVDSHRANLMAKLQVHKTSALVRVAIANGLVGTA